MKHLFKKLAQSIVLIALFFYLSACGALGESSISLITSSGKHSYKIDVAAEPADRAKGLMFVQEMDEGKGMLFVFDEIREVSFWMRNTFIPLDMIFIDEFGTVKSIHENAVPHDGTPIPSNVPVKFVLELNAGQVKKIGLAVGDVAKHKRFKKQPAQ